MGIASKLAGMDAEQIVDELSILMWKPPLASLLDDLPKVPVELRVPLLVLAFSTEVEMGGTLAFLGNSSGRYLNETIDALTLIRAADSAAALSRIRATMSSFGISHQSLSGDLQSVPEWSVVSFNQVHGATGRRFAEETRVDCRFLEGEPEQVCGRLVDWVGANRTVVLRVVERYDG